MHERVNSYNTLRLCTRIVCKGSLLTMKRSVSVRLPSSERTKLGDDTVCYKHFCKIHRMKKATVLSELKYANMNGRTNTATHFDVNEFHG